MRSMKQIRRGDRHNHNVSHSKLRRRGAGAKNKHASNKKWQQSAVLPSEAARKAQIAAIFAAALAAEYIPEDVTPEQLKKIAEKKESQRKAEEARAVEDKKKAAAEKAKKEEQKKAEKAEKKKQQEAAAAAKAAQAAADAQKAEEEKKAKKEQARLEEQKNAEEKAKKKAEQQAEAAKDAKKNKKNKKASESQVEEPVAKVEVAPAEAAAPENKKSKKNKKNSESHTEEPKTVVEEPVAKVEVAPVEAAAPEPAQGGKKNKKNKKNSESQPEETKAEVVEEPVAKVEAPVVEAAPAPAENGKKNKKGKKTPRNSESHDEPKSVVEVVEEAAAKVEVKPVEAVQEIPYPQAEQNAESGNGKKKNKKGKKNSESEGQTVILPPSEPAAEATAVDIPLNGQPKESKEDAPAGTMINGDHNEPDSTGGKNKKKRNKKKSQGHSISEDAPSGAAPIQVNEVSSTDAPVNVQTESLKETITIAQEVDSQMSPTQFAQNVQKLVDSTLKQKGVDAHDESVKLTIEAQLLKLQEKKVPTVHLEYKPITLPILQASPRPARVVSERVYKLLPKDIIYCSEMIEHYGTDFKAMVKDPRNVNRETERSLQRKIRVFKESPHFAVYERAKAEGRPIAEVVAESDI